jgi:hypothetical protein
MWLKVAQFKKIYVSASIAMQAHAQPCLITHVPAGNGCFCAFTGRYKLCIIKHTARRAPHFDAGSL